MAENIDTAELPTISADPLQLVVDFGSPSYLLKNQRRREFFFYFGKGRIPPNFIINQRRDLFLYIDKQLYDELQLLKRTNDYRPTHFTVATQLNPVVSSVCLYVPSVFNFVEIR